MNFPRQVDNSNILEALQNFYKSVDRNLVETYKKYRDINNQNPAELTAKNLDEVEFNQKEFRRALNEIKSGKETVSIRWYDAGITSGANPKLRNNIQEFQLNFRYGKWFREENAIS